ncbi:MAG: sel1 repeat family protein [Shewanellaceae bacterium]|nr:sel1 repeat family protein [Shewanellaceae bacterium]
MKTLGHLLGLTAAWLWACVVFGDNHEKQRIDDDEEVMIKAIDVYSEALLLNYIRRDLHLWRIKKDDCQIVDDIIANAQVLRLPTFQYLYGEMLLYGVCVRKNVPYGMNVLRDSVRQGMPEAMYKLAVYYRDSDYLIENPEKSVRLLLEAAQTGHMRSRLLLVELLLDGFGSARDHEKAYDWLYHARFSKAEQRRKAQTLLAALANILPPSVVYKIQNRPLDEF